MIEYFQFLAGLALLCSVAAILLAFSPARAYKRLQEKTYRVVVRYRLAGGEVRARAEINVAAFSPGEAQECAIEAIEELHPDAIDPIARVVKGSKLW